MKRLRKCEYINIVISNAEDKWKLHLQKNGIWTDEFDSNKFDIITLYQFSSVQFSPVAQSCLTLCHPMNHSMPGLPVHHQLLEFTQTHVHLVSDAMQPSHPLLSPSPLAPNPSQHQSLFQWVNSLHEVAKVQIYLFWRFHINEVI